MRHTQAMVAFGVIGVLALTACGRGDSGSTDASTAIAVDDAPATGDITVWAMGEEAGYLPDFVEGFTAENPDATVSITAIPWGDVATKVQTAVAAGTVPDMIMIGTSMMSLFVSTGGLSPVPEELVDSDDFFPGATDSTVADGVTYGVPWYVEVRVLYYRTDLAEAAGVSAPTTWDGLTAFSAALQEQGGGKGIELPVGEAEAAAQVIMPWYAQDGGQVLNDAGDGYDLDNEHMVAALEYYGSFFSKGLAATTGYGDTQTSAFVDGSAPMMFSGPWMARLLADQTDDRWVSENVSTMALPSGTHGNASYIGGAHLGVFTDAKNPEGGWKLIRWLSEATTQQQFYDVSTELPAVQSAWDYEPLTSSDRIAVLNDQLTATWAPPTVPSWDELADYIGTEAEKIANGSTTAQDAATAIQAKADALGLGW